MSVDDRPTPRYLTRCIVCDGQQFRALYQSNFRDDAGQAARYFLAGRVSAVHGDIVRCLDCGFVFTNPQFESYVYDEIYGQLGAAGTSVQSAAEARNADRRRALVEYSGGGTLLDLGCGDGSFVRSLPENYEAHGFEVRACDDVRPVAHGSLLYGRFPEAVANGHLTAEAFDVITAWDVLEHLPDLDRYMRAIVRLINSGGLLLFSVPNVQSLAARLSRHKWNCLLLEHLWYFDPTTIRRYLRRFGLQGRVIRAFPYAADLGSMAQRVRQTYGVSLPMPRVLQRTVLRLPIGLMLCAFVKDSDARE